MSVELGSPKEKLKEMGCRPERCSKCWNTA